MNASADIIRLKFMFRIHFLLYLAAIAILGIANLFVYPEVLWVIWFVIAWGIIILIHRTHLHLQIIKHKNGDAKLLKAQAEHLKNDAINFSELANPKKVFERESERRIAEPFNEQEDIPDLEDIEIAKVIVDDIDKIKPKRGRPKGSKNKKRAKRKVGKRTAPRRRVTKNRAAGRKAAKKAKHKKKAPKRKAAKKKRIRKRR